MDLALLVYGISLLDKFQSFFTFLILIAGMASVGTLIYTLDASSGGFEYSWNLNKDGTIKESVLAKRVAVKGYLKWSVISLAFFSFIMVLIPNEKTAYTMVGAYAAQKVVENDKVQSMSGKVLKVIEQKLDSYIDEGAKDAQNRVEKAIKGDK